jgi:hypothetical protein
MQFIPFALPALANGVFSVRVNLVAYYTRDPKKAFDSGATKMLYSSVTDREGDAIISEMFSESSGAFTASRSSMAVNMIVVANT